MLKMLVRLSTLSEPITAQRPVTPQKNNNVLCFQLPSHHLLIEAVKIAPPGPPLLPTDAAQHMQPQRGTPTYSPECFGRDGAGVYTHTTQESPLVDYRYPLACQAKQFSFLSAGWRWWRLGASQEKGKAQKKKENRIGTVK